MRNIAIASAALTIVALGFVSALPASAQAPASKPEPKPAFSAPSEKTVQSPYQTAVVRKALDSSLLPSEPTYPAGAVHPVGLPTFEGAAGSIDHRS